MTFVQIYMRARPAQDCRKVEDVMFVDKCDVGNRTVPRDRFIVDTLLNGAIRFAKKKKTIFMSIILNFKRVFDLFMMSVYRLLIYVF